MNKPTHTDALETWNDYLKQFMPLERAKEISKDVREKILIKHKNSCAEFNRQKSELSPLDRIKLKYSKFSKDNRALSGIACNAAGNLNRRLQNWVSAKASSLVKKKGDYDSLNCGRYKGKFNRIIWNYQPRYTSYYRIAANKKAIVYVYGFAGQMKKTLVKSPKGMSFENDANGLVLRRLSDGMDYHPTSEDLLSKRFASLVRERMADNFKKRLLAKKSEKLAKTYEKLFQKDLRTTMVTLFDSRKAGNCIEGSLSFAEKRLNIPREEILKGGFIFKVPAIKLIKTGEQKAIAAAKIAWQRETEICI